MELLLNLAWLLLALPAYWLWRHCEGTPARRRFDSLQCLLALGCALVILFPVVSATDDLQAMRADMEESPASKRNVSHRTSDKPSASKVQNQPALAVTATSLFVNDTAWHLLPPSPTSIPTAFVIVATGRAPPVSFPG